MLNVISEEGWKNESYGYFAGFGVRLLAFIVDLIVFIPLALIFIGIAWFGNIDVPSELFSGLFILYVIIFHWRKGATIGKKQTELRVEKIDGTRISFGQSVIRQIFPLISIIIMIILNQYPATTLTRTYEVDEGAISFTRTTSNWQFYLSLFAFSIVIIDVLWIFTNKEKKTLHDIVARTYCKKK
jgi:uncharacterized RDD family membrane protein YckC